MKKTLLGIAGILAIISSANAVDTSQIKAASDKTLWVESNQVCIPRNPCENPNYNQYCNRDFANIQLADREYEAVINHYAEVKKLDCKAVPQDGKFIGQDYVVCMGNDVMVFEFDDINEHFTNYNCLSDGAMKAVCVTIGGRYEMDGECVAADKAACLMINKHFSFGEKLDNGDPLPCAGWTEEKSTCTLGCPGRFM